MITPQSDMATLSTETDTTIEKTTAARSSKRAIADQVYRAEIVLMGRKSDSKVKTALEAAGYTQARRNP